MAELMTGRALFPGDDRKNSDTFPSSRFKVCNRYISVQLLCLQGYINFLMFDPIFSIKMEEKNL